MIVARSLKSSHGSILAIPCPEVPETETVVHAFLKNHEDFVISKEFGQLPDALGTMMDVPGVFKSFPHLKQMDGFFAVRLQQIS